MTEYIRVTRPDEGGLAQHRRDIQEQFARARGDAPKIDHDDEVHDLDS